MRVVHLRARAGQARQRGLVGVAIGREALAVAPESGAQRGVVRDHAQRAAPDREANVERRVAGGEDRGALVELATSVE